MQINYRGDITAPSGYSRALRVQIRALQAAGVEVYGEVSRKDVTQLSFKDDPYWKDRMDHLISRNRMCPIRVWHETPEFFVPDPLQYNIAFVHWETSGIVMHDVDGLARNNWVKQMNRMDEVWTSVQFSADVFRKCGVTVPIHVFPHPIDMDVYSPGEPSAQFLADQAPLDGKMVFLSVFQFTKRKNPHDLLMGWMAEFGQQEDVALVVKTYGSSFQDNSGIVKYVRAMKEGSRIPDLVSNMHFILDLVPEEDMPDLYRMSDVFILPTYGEGFGMPYQESMACGRPVIYTDASSPPEFCVGWPIACDPEPVSGMLNIPWYNASQDWWKVRVTDMRRCMREAYNAWKDGTITDVGKKAREQIERLHSFEGIGASMRARLESILQSIRDGSSRPDLAARWATELDIPAEVFDTPAS